MQLNQVLALYNGDPELHVYKFKNGARRGGLPEFVVGYESAGHVIYLTRFQTGPVWYDSLAPLRNFVKKETRKCTQDDLEKILGAPPEVSKK